MVNVKKNMYLGRNPIIIINPEFSIEEKDHFSTKYIQSTQDKVGNLKEDNNGLVRISEDGVASRNAHL